jgi:hypothetical protein
MSISKVKRILIAPVISILILIFFVIQSVRTGIVLYEVGIYILIVINSLFLMVLISFYKTRIEIDKDELYFPSYLWYQDFKIDINDVPMFKTIKITDILSIDMIDIIIEVSSKTDKGMLVKIKNKYDVVVSLDGYSQEKQQEIFDLITKKLKQ